MLVLVGPSVGLLYFPKRREVTLPRSYRSTLLTKKSFSILILHTLLDLRHPSFLFLCVIYLDYFRF